MEKLRLESQEQALREAVLAGSESAWRALYDANFNSIYAFVFHRTGKDRHRTEDVVQETWLVAVRRIVDFDPRLGPFESWLKGIAGNILKNHRRRWQRDGRSQSLDGQQPSAPATGESPTGELMALALTALPEHYQIVLRAKYEERLTVAEISQRLSHTSKAVESLLSRARDALRRAYQQLQNEEEGDR
jgi:RNA polymerase sigma-70 factor (ECF subfamily)